MYLLDTNIASELRKLRPHGGVLSWYSAQDFDTLRLSSLSLYEMQAGAELTRRQDSRKAEEIEAWISEIEGTWSIVPFGPREARLTAKLMQGEEPELFIDAMIAASAMASGFTVATRNTRHFERFDVGLVNPFLFRG